jgi:hypothetical protein
MTNEVSVIESPMLPSASPATAQVCAALAAAQGKFENPKRTKTATVNPRDGGRGYTFAYAPLEEVVNAIKGPLAENGLLRQQYLFRDGSGTYWVRTVLWHASGEWISGDYPVIFAKDSAQGFAGGVTYAKRNGLSLLLGLAAEDDDDGNVSDGNVATIAPTVPARSRRPKPPAENVMVPHDPVTGEVDEKPPRQLDEEYLRLDAMLMAAAQGRGGLPAKEKLRAAWVGMTPQMQHKLLPNLPGYKSVAEQVDMGFENAQG